MPNAVIFCDFGADLKILTPPPSSLSAIGDHFLTIMIKNVKFIFCQRNDRYG